MRQRPENCSRSRPRPACQPGADATTTIQGIEIRPVFQWHRLRVLLSLLIAAVGASACTYDRGEGPPQIHIAEFRVAPPDGNTVEVCHAYTCQMKTDFYFR